MLKKDNIQTILDLFKRNEQMKDTTVESIYVIGTMLLYRLCDVNS